MAKKVINYEKLKLENLIIENKKLIIKKKDILRKFNQRYGTAYVLDTSTLDLKDPTLYKKLAKISTKELKGAGAVELKEEQVIKPKYSVHGVELTADEYREMKELEAKANKLRGRRFDGDKYYTGYFTSYKGYQRYMDILRSVSTREGYLEGIKTGLITFKTNVESHMEDIIATTTDADELKERQELLDWVNTYWDTYSRLDKAYKFVKASGYTAEHMARIFFDSDPKRNKLLYGEDIQLIKVLKKMRAKYGWKTEGRITKLELSYPMTARQKELARQQEL